MNEIAVCLHCHSPLVDPCSFSLRAKGTESAPLQTGRIHTTLGALIGTLQDSVCVWLCVCGQPLMTSASA